MTENAVVVRDVNFEEHAMTPERIRQQVNLIQEIMKGVMKDGEHYGVIPGCNKPSLLKPGAEKLSTTFRLSPTYQIQKSELQNGHREYEIICTLTHINSGIVVGQGVGCCTTMEGKYRFRKANQKCPKCGKEDTIIKGKKEYGGGWLCFEKKGGCGAKFRDGDQQIENQNMGRVEHDNPADYWNTVLKMAKKRAHVDAVLTATAASDIFTQDIEDLPPEVITTTAARPTQSPPPIQPKPPEAQPKSPDATPAQAKKIYAVGTEKGASKELTTEMCRWYRKGDKMTKEEASHIIEHFDEVMQRYMDEELGPEGDTPEGDTE